tara:strand:+ start:32 stop:409 length:378 start_codon:yes stop_codon:yes gene_type:complete
MVGTMKNTDIKSEIKKIISDYKDIMSKDLQQALENLHDEIESETKRLKRIHINMHKIRANKKNGTKEPVITIKTGKKNIYAHTVKILGGSDIIYSPDKPLSCGARVWIETYNPVIVDKNWDEKIL